MKILLYILYYLAWTFASVVAPQTIFYLIFVDLFHLNLSTAAINTLYIFLSYLTSLALIIIVPYKFFKKSRSSRTTLGLTGLPKWSDLGLAPIGFLVYTFTAALLTGLLSKILPSEIITAPQTLSFPETSLYFFHDKIFAFISLCVIAPIAEELIFRGWLYAKLRAKIPSRASLPLSIILVSLLFAILHGQWSVGLNVFCLSVVLCGLREVTGTIYSGILLHIIKNAVAFYLLYVV